jgi:hypothetical protein
MADTIAYLCAASQASRIARQENRLPFQGAWQTWDRVMHEAKTERRANQ